MPHSSQNVCQNGKWFWKDETNTLEFMSQSGQHVDRHDKRKKLKTHQDHSKKNEQVSSSLGNHSFQNKSSASKYFKSSRCLQRPSSDSVITLHDLKYISLEMFTENNDVPLSFYNLLQTEQFDKFLLNLFIYFDCFFEKMSLDNIPQNAFIEKSLSEVGTYSKVISKMEAAQKLLGQSYCILILGLGLKNVHHMACGTVRISDSVKDRCVFETLYSFCSFIVWINFKRKDFGLVRKEIGRMLRSDHFNPALHRKHSIAAVTAADKLTSDPQLTNFDADNKFPGKCAGVSSALSQRSPVIMSILPRPNEESMYLFQRKKISQERYNQPVKPEEDLTSGLMKSMESNLINLKVGLLGEPVKKYNLSTLIPLSDDKEEMDRSLTMEKLPDSARRPVSSRPSLADISSRQQTILSQTTVEGPDEED